MILYHQIEHPLARPLFRFAVFICGDLPFAHKPGQGVDVTEEYVRDGVFHGDIINEPEVLSELKQSESGRSSLKIRTDSGYSSEEDDGASPYIVRRFVPHVDRERIEIPNAHVYGETDIDLKKSLALAQMCNEKMRWTYMHPGGHEIPRSEEVHKKIVEVVHAATVRSEIMS